MPFFLTEVVNCQVSTNKYGDIMKLNSEIYCYIHILTFVCRLASFNGNIKNKINCDRYGYYYVYQN